jgi:DNA polymerase III epsilon subunit-like protein
MRYLFYDTETTGLIPKEKNYEKYPHIVQFSYIVYDTESETIEKLYDEIIHSEVTIPEEATNIHKITSEMTMKSQVDINECLFKFIEECANVDLVIGHNLSYDNAMVICELERCKGMLLEHKDDYEMVNQHIRNFEKMKFHCTMKENIQYCNIRQNYKNSTATFAKFPKLIELHEKIFGKDSVSIQLHNSLNDVLICFRCFCKLKHNIDVISKFP